MNSYNDNLWSGVRASLQSLELEHDKLRSQLQASMLALYHAQGAVITAGGKLAAAQSDLGFKTQLKVQAINNAGIANNLLSSANQANQYFKQSVTNTSVGASNVQIAANSIARLDSDAGSIFSMVSAAGEGSDIYTLALEVRDLMNGTRYTAEQAAKLAMEASQLVSEVSVPTVVDQARSTGKAMNNILQIASAEYDTAVQNVTAAYATLATSSAQEKLAEGALKVIAVDHHALKLAYRSVNAQLNLSLAVMPDSDSAFTVSFKPMKSPFAPIKGAVQPLYPVDRYYFVVVKKASAQIFSLTVAENLLPENPLLCTPIDMTQGMKTTGLPGEETTIRVDFMKLVDKDGKTYHLKDSDGALVKPGQNYVVFIYATYQDIYKRKLNCFEDFLSAPSMPFCITHQLDAVDHKSIRVLPVPAKKTANEIADETSFLEAMGQATNKEPGLIYKVSFRTTGPADPKIQYRLMFLPVTMNGLLTRPGLEALLDKEITPVQAPFFFNLQLAGEVAKGNYIPAIVRANQAQPKTSAAAGSKTVNWAAYIGPATTDNFGNPLNGGTKYIPVVFSVSIDEEQNLPQFANALSDFENTDPVLLPLID